MSPTTVLGAKSKARDVRSGYRYLFVGLLALLTLYPTLTLLGGWVVDLLVLLVLVSGVFAVSSSRSQLIIASTLAIATVVLGFWAEHDPQNTIVVLSLISGLGFFGFLALVILQDVFKRRQRVTAEVIYAALAVYLLMGLAFAFGYGLIDILQPDAFTSRGLIAGNSTEVFEGFVYFSFVTLTTLGFGDITPNTLQAGAFVYLQAMAGQVYLAVLVARLVSLQIAHAGGE